MSDPVFPRHPEFHEPAADPAAALREAGEKRAKSLAFYNADHRALCDHVIDARDAGVPLTDIAAIAGVSRMTVYNIIDRRDGRREIGGGNG
jgi:hypothetical protein